MQIKANELSPHTHWMTKLRLTILSVDKEVEQLESSYTACQNIK